MKYKIGELEGALLDVAVAKADGEEARVESTGRCAMLHVDREHGDGTPFWASFEPSTDGRIGIEIIGRERITVWPTVVYLEPPDPNEPDVRREQWAAYHPKSEGLGGWTDGEGGIDVTARDGMAGQTPLIAAMRAFVAVRFGEFVDLP